MPAEMPPQTDLRFTRRALGMTLDELAKRITDMGVPITKFALSNVETGKRRGSAQLMYAWARVFNNLPEEIRQASEQRAYARMYDKPTPKRKIGSAA